MKVWLLKHEWHKSYAVIFAESEENAFDKLRKQYGDTVGEQDEWIIEEFTPGTYDGVLYFSWEVINNVE